MYILFFFNQEYAKVQCTEYMYCEMNLPTLITGEGITRLPRLRLNKIHNNNIIFNI